jgi:hypothetical protein
MRRLSREPMANWNDGQTRDLTMDMPRLTLAIASESLFGAAMNDDAALVASAMSELMHLFRE